MSRTGQSETSPTRTRTSLRQPKTGHADKTKSYFESSLYPKLNQEFERSTSGDEQEKSKFMEMISSEKNNLDNEYNQYKERRGHQDADGWASIFENKARALGDKLREITEVGKSEASGWTQAAMDKAQQVWESVKEYEQLAAEKVKEIEQAAVDKTKEVAEGVIEGVKEVAGFGDFDNFDQTMGLEPEDLSIDKKSQLIDN